VEGSIQFVSSPNGEKDFVDFKFPLKVPLIFGVFWVSVGSTDPGKPGGVSKFMQFFQIVMFFLVPSPILRWRAASIPKSLPTTVVSKIREPTVFSIKPHAAAASYQGLHETWRFSRVSLDSTLWKNVE